MTILKFRPLRLLGIFGALSLATLVAGPAWSTVLPGIAGHAFFAPTCFGAEAPFTAAVINFCAGGDPGTPSQRKFIVPIQTTNNANHTFRGRVRGNGSQTTVCRAVAVNSSDGAVVTNFQGSSSQAFSLITMGTLFISSSSTAQVECDVAQGGGAVLSIGD
jgi:hypothetical protein